MSTPPILTVFLDGVGLAPPGNDNPLSEKDLASLARLAGGAFVAGCGGIEAEHVVREIDANLGVEGLPQSATGQTSLFTGVNAARSLGRHVAAYPGPRLKEILSQAGVMARVRAAGESAAFANAYRRSTLEEFASGTRRVSAMVFLAMSAGVPLRGIDELREGRAVSWDFERDLGEVVEGEEAPRISAAQAGCHAVGLARDHALTVLDCFLTDLAGHRRFGLTPELAAGRIDRFLGGVLDSRPEEMTVVVTSDHGNLEEADHRRHTRNRVPLIAVGPLAPHFEVVEALDGVTPALIGALGIDEGDRFH